MGVPTFYRWLCNRYPRVPKDLVDNFNDRNLDLSDTDAIGLELLSPNPNGEFDNLYLDMNGIIHPCCHPENMEQPESEEVMFKCIMEYIDRIFFLVRPRKLIYLAIDGVAPRAKINQQRSRRFKSAALADLEDETYEKLVKEYMKKKDDMQIPLRKNKWDSNVITPGTEFMHKLSKVIVEYIKDRVEKYDAWRRIVVIFSDSNVPGEGEHKIMDFIRSQRHCPDYDPNTRHVLHGMDADLIMLGLATHEPNFYIIREIVSFFVYTNNKTVSNEPDDKANNNLKVPSNPDDLNKTQKYMKMMRENWKPLQLLQLCVLREYLTHQLKFVTGFDNGEYIDFERCVDDLVLMIFFCGNDFLPNLPSISITGGSIDQLILLYQKLLPSLNDYLSNEGNLNFHSISTFFYYLSNIENETFKHIFEYEKKSQQYHKNRLENLNKANANNGKFNGNSSNGSVSGGSTDVNEDKSEANEKEDVEKEFMKKYEEELDKLKSIDDVKLSVDVTLNDPKLWKEAYYKEKFHLTDQDDLQAFVQEVSYNYVKGICWVLQYYYQGCPSWSWYYPYHYSPFCSDLDFSSLYFDDVSEENTKRENGTANDAEKNGVKRGSSEDDSQVKREKRKQEDKALIKFDYGVPLTPFQQLMGVMPIRSSHCIPKPLRVLMTDPESPLKDFYPVKFQEDPNGKRYKYQWVALLPFIDEQKLLSYVKPIEEQLSEQEKYRNRVSKNIVVLTKQNRKTFLNQINQTLPIDDPNTDLDKDLMEYFVLRSNKKHKSVLLKGSIIPPKVLTVQDIMEEQRNRGFNCEVAKRIILNMLSSNKNRDPFGSNQPETVLRDTARDYHQYHNQYNPTHYSPSNVNQYSSNSHQNQYHYVNANKYQQNSYHNHHYSNNYHTSNYHSNNQPNNYHNHHSSQRGPYDNPNYPRHGQYQHAHTNQRYGNQHGQNRHYNNQYHKHSHYQSNNNQYQDYKNQYPNRNQGNYVRRSSDEKYY